MLDLVTDELKVKLQPVNSKLKAIEKERAERRKVRKRTKVAQPSAGGSSVPAAQTSEDVNMQDASGASNATSEGATETNTGELEDESVYRSREKQEVEELISDELKTDVGCSASGLYDLVGKHNMITSSILLSFAYVFFSHRNTQRCDGRFRALYRLREKVGFTFH